MSLFQQASLSNVPSRPATAVIVKWKRLGATMAQRRNGKPLKLTEHCLLSIAILTTEFQTASGSKVSTLTVRQELHKMGFHGRAAAHKPKISIRTAKRRLGGVKLIAIGIWSSGNTTCPCNV
jgi:hypothetical protein